MIEQNDLAIETYDQAATYQLDQEDIISKFKRECRRVRDGCNFDISKCFKDGKPLIIDGSHIDPDCYLSLEKSETTGHYQYRIKTTFTEFPPGEEN